MPFIQFQFRRGTGAEWSAANTVLAPGEMGIDTDTYRFKIGDGTTAWNNLTYSPVADGPQGAIQYNDSNAIAGSSNLVYTDGETLSIAGNLLPQANVTYSLGNANLRWANLFLAGNTIDLGGSQIKSDFEGAIVLVPPVTIANPNPTALVINTTGSIVPVETVDGVPNANAVTDALTDPDSTFGNVLVLGNLTANQSTVLIGNISIQGDTISSVDGTITIDPAAPGSTGTLIVEGNLQVKGNVTYIDSQTITVNDLMINMANNANTSSQADGGGIAVGPVGSEYATLTFDNGNTAWRSNINMSVTGNVAATGGITATGNVSGNNVSGTLITGTLATAAQPNITSVGNLSGLTITGNVTGNLLPSANVTYDLGSATQAWRSLYISGNTLYIADESMAVNSASGLWSFTSNGGEITLGADSIFANSVSATYILGNGALLTGIVTASGNVNFANIANIAYNVDAANVTGTVANANYALNAGTAYSIAGANVSGEVANAAYANTAGTATTVTANSQPNITSLGTLTELTVSGNVSANYILGNGSQLTGLPEQYGNANVAAYLPTYTGNVAANNVTITGVFSGNGSALTSLTGANVTGTVANANYAAFANVAYNVNAANVTGTVANANYANTAGTAATVTTNAQPNITSLGSLTSLTATGNANVGNLGTAGLIVATGNVTGGNLVTAGQVSAGNVVATGNVTATYYIGDGSYLTGLYGVVGQYLFANIASNVSPYYQAVFVSEYEAGTTGTATQTVSNTPTLLVSFLTNTGFPNQTYIPVGVIDFSYETQKASGASTYTTYAEIYKRTTGGTETLLLTSDVTSTSALNTLIQQRVSATNSMVIPLDITDRILVKIYAQILSGANASITVRWDDATSAGFDLPAPPTSITQFVPYLNATANIDLGVYGVTSGFIASAGNANVGNLGTTGLITATGNITGGNLSGSLITGTLTTAAQPNITSLGTLTSLAITGSLSAANITASGILTVSGNGESSLAGNLNMSNRNIVGLADPVNSTDAATKQYVDSIAEGLHVHAPCAAATPANLAVITGGTVTYNNGNSGVGATLTVSGGTYGNIDGVNIAVANTRILVKSEANAAHNGIYVYSNATVLTRSVDFDTPTEMAGGDFTFVQQGTLYNDTGWVCTDPVVTVGTSAVNFVQFSGAGTYTAGTGLTLDGGQFSISNTAVTASSYGGSDAVATFTVNAQGQLTAASNTAITANAANLSGTTLASTIVNSSLTSVGNLTALTVTGNISGNYITASEEVLANRFEGNGYQLTSINAANISGTVANANYALYSNTVLASSQPNITSVGNLTTLTVTGNISGNYILGNGSQLTGIVTTSNAAALTGNTLSSNVVNSSLTSVGTLATLSVSGNVTAGNIVGGGAGTPTVSSSTALILSSPTSVRVQGGGVFRLPNLSQAQINALTPQLGDMVYNTDTGFPQIYYSGGWGSVSLF